MELPTEPFLSPWSRDIGVVASLIGVALSLIGFGIGAWQLYAAVSNLKEAQRTYAKHVYSQVHRLLGEAQSHVGGQAWQLAAMRLRDVAGLLGQLGEDWEQESKMLAEFAVSFDRVAIGAIQYKGIGSKWATTFGEISQRVSAKVPPFG